jgi:hypothetical protein
MADNEHALPSLGQSEELSVQHSVGEPVPELSQPSEEGSKVPSAVRRQNAMDVLPYDPTGAHSISQSEIDEGQVSTRIRHASSESCDAEGLTRGSSHENVG